MENKSFGSATKRRKQITQIEVDSRCLLELRVSCIRQRLFQEKSRLLTCAKRRTENPLVRLELYVLTRRINHLEKKYFDNRSVGWRFSRQIFWKIIERGSVEWHNKGSMTFARELQHFLRETKISTMERSAEEKNHFPSASSPHKSRLFTQTEATKWPPQQKMAQ